MNKHISLFSRHLDFGECRALGLTHSYTIQSFRGKQKLLWNYTVLEMLFPGQHVTGIANMGVDWQLQRAAESLQFSTNDLGAQWSLPNCRNYWENISHRNMTSLHLFWLVKFGPNDLSLYFTEHKLKVTKTLQYEPILPPGTIASLLKST